MTTVRTDFCSQIPIFTKTAFGATGLSTATAFFYRRNESMYLVSNWHVLSGRNAQTLEPLDKNCGIPDRVECYALKASDFIERVWHSFPLLDDGGNPRWLHHPSLQNQVDVAVLPVEIPASLRTCAMNDLAEAEMTLRVSHDVFVLGYPLGIQDVVGLPIWKRASVASEPGTSAPSFLVDTATRQGMSGSPVILRYRGFHKSDPTTPAVSAEDWFGEGDMFVGVYSGRLLGASELEAQLGIVWKSRVIDEIIDGGSRAEI
ncbi:MULTISPECIES: trypsin-like peptidase domain-containing protein [unclassified Variovorax]|uniref:trypsin-like peptidase domain-containing protein n=1 Tax=unclassified Variovorax TaxID=663243 RepID=UPI0006F75A1B|nr:trypsin-like peptidase domain-containing protein [Variovorax sp. Root411]KQW54022.1 hypothetical protein ASC92_22045 [Variovorax sp. Root411]